MGGIYIEKSPGRPWLAALSTSLHYIRSWLIDLFMSYHFFTRQAQQRITSADAGAALLPYLLARFPYHDEAQWAELIAAGRVQLNGRATLPAQLLCAGDCLQYQPLALEEPAIDDQLTLLHEDPELLLLNKSGNLPCHPAGCFFNHTLWALLKTTERACLPEPLRQLPAIERPHFVNRLDRETSGLVMVAKNARAAKRYARTLQHSQSRKLYLVLVEGRFPDCLDAKGWLRADPRSPVRKKRRFTLAAAAPELPSESAHTRFRRLQRGENLSLLCAELFSGRTHQIRATLASSGFPVVGDKLYGLDDEIYLRFIADELSDEDQRRLRLPRQALHAWKIFLHEKDGAREFCAPLPADMRQLLEADGMRGEALSSAD
jgi:23S rRNA pseudouridine1911/1915/1917 synthase